MNSMLLLKVAGPMILLSILSLTIGALAAYNVHEQQQENSELIAREVHGMFAVENVFLVGREIRREIDLFLRTGNREHLSNVDDFLKEAALSIGEAKQAARTPKEAELIQIVDRGFSDFERRFRECATSAANDETTKTLATLNDEFLTLHILEPIKTCIGYNRSVVDRTAAGAKVASQHLRIGFLLLWITGSIAGLLFGLGIARALSRYIVQLDVSIRGVTGKLHDMGRTVHISRFGDFEGLELSVKQLESDIGDFVQRLQERETEFLRGEQLATLGQIAAGMAHELRNPLMPIKVLVQAAMERGPNEGIKGESLTILNDEILRLERSIQAFLDFARPPALETARVDLQSVARRAIELIAPQAARQRVKIDAAWPSGEVFAKVDVGQLHQVLLNLMLNSIDALPDGGVISIELQTVTQAAERHENVAGDEFSEHDAMRLPQEGDARRWCVLRVRDSGPGFPEASIGKAFAPFFTTKETGTGLGLPICRRIVHDHGGDIVLRNHESGGAEFTIRLPRVD